MSDPTNASAESEHHSLAQERSGGTDPRIKEAGACAANCTFSNVSSRIRGNCRQEADLTPQNSNPDILSSTEGYGLSRVDKDVLKDRCHLSGTVKPAAWQRSTEAESTRTAEGRGGSSSSPSLTLHMCCGAVPVICHSSSAVSTMPAYRPACRASVNTSSSPASCSENESNKPPNHCRSGILDHLGAPGWDGKPTQQHTCSGTERLMKTVHSGLSHIMNHNNHYAYCESLQTNNIKHRDGSVCSSLKYKPDLSSDDRQQLDLSDCHSVSSSAGAEEPSEDLVAGDPQSEGDSDTGSDSYSGTFSPGADSYSCGPKIVWYPGLHRPETSAKYVASSRHEHDSSQFCLAVSSTPEPGLVPGGHSAFGRCTSLDLEAISDAETSEPHFPVSVPVDDNVSESMEGVENSYHGHVHYHCLPQDDVHSDYKHSHQSEQSSDEEAATFTSLGRSPLREHLSKGPTEQLLLLDISTRHSELLVSYKHRDDQEKKGVVFGTEIRNDNWSGAASAAGVDMRTRGAERCDESGTREQRRSGAGVKNKAGVLEELTKREEHENQISTLTVCPAPRVSDSVQASVPSTLSVCIPSALPASMSTNISGHLSAPGHHAFQCTLCDRAFSQRGSLNRHVRSHLGVRPFPCPRCPMTFSRQYRVTEHMRVHQRCSLENYPKPPASSI